MQGIFSTILNISRIILSKLFQNIKFYTMKPPIANSNYNEQIFCLLQLRIHIVNIVYNVEPNVEALKFVF